MRARLLLAGWLIAVTGTALPGQAPTLPYDHVHLAAPDPAAAVAWYIRHLGGAASPRPDRVIFGESLVIFQRADGRAPSAGGAVDHLGFSVADLDATMRELERSGVRVSEGPQDVREPVRRAFIEDPWGVKIEILQDAGAAGLTHIHVTADRPDEALGWYARMFGGERTRVHGVEDALRYGRVWLSARPGAPAGGRRVIDHLGWRTANVDETIAALEAQGVKILTAPGPSPGGNRVAFVEGPAGVRIEIVQRPQ